MRSYITYINYLTFALLLLACDTTNKFEPIEGLREVYTAEFTSLKSSCQNEYTRMLTKHDTHRVTLSQKNKYVYIRSEDENQPWQLKGSLCKSEVGKIEALCMISYTTESYIPYNSLQTKACILQHNIPSQSSFDTRPNAKNTVNCCELINENEQNEAMVLYVEGKSLRGTLKGELFINTQGLETQRDVMRHVITCQGPLHCRYESLLLLTP